MRSCRMTETRWTGAQNARKEVQKTYAKSNVLKRPELLLNSLDLRPALYVASYFAKCQWFGGQQSNNKRKTME